MYIFIYFPDTITNYHKFCDKDEERYILAQFWMSRVYDGCLELKVRTVFLLVGLGDNEFSHTENLLKLTLHFLVSCPFPIFQASGTQKNLSHTVSLHDSPRLPIAKTLVTIWSHTQLNQDSSTALLKSCDQLPHFHLPHPVPITL